MKIATVAVYVDDQAEARAFWTEKVGFTVHNSKPMGPDAEWLEVGPEGAESCLVIYPKSMMEDWAEHKPSVVFECSDLRQMHDQLSSRGVEFSQEPTEMPWGPFAIFLDNEGNWFGLRQGG